MAVENNAKVPDYDDNDACLFKMEIPYASIQKYHIFNNSLQHFDFPDNMNTADNPNIKNDDAFSLSNDSVCFISVLEKTRKYIHSRFMFF